MSSGHEPDCDLGRSIDMLQRRYRSEVDTHMEQLPRGSRGYQLLYAIIPKELPNQLALSEYLGIARTVLLLSRLARQARTEPRAHAGAEADL